MRETCGGTDRLKVAHKRGQIEVTVTYIYRHVDIAQKEAAKYDCIVELKCIGHKTTHIFKS